MALEGGGRFVVAVGGDGTVHEVVNGMLDGSGSPVGDDPVLGVVAAGSGCDFIRTFGLPGDATRACLHLTGDNTYPLDVGKITYTTVSGGRDVRYFANVAEAGLFAAVAARAERMSPRLGGSKYFFGFWATLPRFKLATVRVQADRKTYEGPAFAVVAANAQYNGGGMKISPRSYPGDGVLDVLVFKGPRSDAFTMIPKVYRGEHLPHDHVEEFRVKERLLVEADRPLPIEADGEVLGNTPATFEVLAHAIRMKL
jgi:YegS/Rv2252/BmrU family lipid kinase